MSDIIRGIFIKPARQGLIVRDPRTMQPLSESGEWKPRDSYWLRRVRDKDVIEITLPKSDAPVAKQDKPALKVVDAKSKTKTEGDA